MDTPFGTSWDGLKLADVEAFLAEPREEGQLWDAKGVVVTSETVRKYVSGFANTVFGGYLVLGAEWDKKAKCWNLDGWQPPGEASQWIGDCISGGVDPVPSFDASKTWELPNGRFLTVVRVWPLGIPPCVTIDGHIFERVGSSTLPVRDAPALHRLVDRGQLRREQLEKESLEGARYVNTNGLTDRVHHVTLALAIASLPADLTSLVFRQSVAQALREELLQHRTDPMTPLVAGRMGSESLTMASLSQFGNGREGFTVELRRTGAISASLADPDITSAVESLSYGAAKIETLWNLASFAAELLGAGGGPSHVSIGLRESADQQRTVHHWAGTRPDPDSLGLFHREIRRMHGDAEWEPE